jgi:hypothetical protein
MPERGLMRRCWCLSLLAITSLPACATGSRPLPPVNGVPWQTAPAADEAAIVALFDSTAAGVMINDHSG